VGGGWEVLILVEPIVSTCHLCGSYLQPSNVTAAPAAPERGPSASAEEEQPREEEGDGLLFALETRVKNLEAIEAAEPWRPKVSQMIRAYKQPEEIAQMKVRYRSGCA
jgi:hypothetical protein